MLASALAKITECSAPLAKRQRPPAREPPLIALPPARPPPPRRRWLLGGRSARSAANSPTLAHSVSGLSLDRSGASSASSLTDSDDDEAHWTGGTAFLAPQLPDEEDRKSTRLNSSH